MPLRDPRAQVLLAARRPPDGLRELRVGGVLQDEAKRTGLQRTLGKGGTPLHRERNDPGVWCVLAQTTNHLDARTTPRGQVHHEHIRSVAIDAAGRRVRVASLSDDLDAILRIE